MEKFTTQFNRISYRLAFSICFLCAFYYGCSRMNPISSVSADTKEQYVEDEILIQWAFEADDESKNSIILEISQIEKVLDEVDEYMLCSTNSLKDSVLAVDLLLKFPLVISAEVNSFISSLKIEHNYSDSQWALDNIGNYKYRSNGIVHKLPSKYDLDLDIFEAWSILGGNPGASKEVIVAVIDTGIDYNHPDLKQQMWKNSGEIPGDDLDNDGNGYVDDIYGWDYYNNDSSVCHYDLEMKDLVMKKSLSQSDDRDDHGTHCAGIIAASANSAAGVKGVASNVNVKLMSLKVNGGSNLKGSVFNAVKAIKYADRMGAEICNISWCSYIPSSAMEAAIRESRMLFVAAAGNDGSNNDATSIYPASFELDNIVSVTYVNPEGRLAMNANYGLNSVDIAAPGVDIISTIVGSYDYMSGSSMAAPHVTGIAAMLYSYSDDLYASNVKKVILEAYKPLSDLKGKTSTPGIPSALIAISSLSKLRMDHINPTLSIKTGFKQSELLLQFKKSDRGGSGVHMLRYFIGTRTAEDFKNGTAGTVVEGNTLALSKAGTYTFYLSDYAGNAVVYPYVVMDDTKPPVLKMSYVAVKNSKAIKIQLTGTDLQSGIKTLKYMKGAKSVRDFSSSSSGKALKLIKGKVNFVVDEQGVYSIYVADYRGNKMVRIINARN